MQIEKLIVEIVKEQSLIIGEPLAKSRAEDAGVVKFNSANIEDLSVTQQDNSKVISRLFKSYEELFGQASIEVCLDVLKRHPSNEITPMLPEELRSAFA